MASSPTHHQTTPTPVNPWMHQYKQALKQNPCPHPSPRYNDQGFMMPTLYYDYKHRQSCFESDAQESVSKNAISVRRAKPLFDQFAATLKKVNRNIQHQQDIIHQYSDHPDSHNTEKLARAKQQLHQLLQERDTMIEQIQPVKDKFLELFQRLICNILPDESFEVTCKMAIDGICFTNSHQESPAFFKNPYASSQDQDHQDQQDQQDIELVNDQDDDNQDYENDQDDQDEDHKQDYEEDNQDEDDEQDDEEDKQENKYYSVHRDVAKALNLLRHPVHRE